MGEKGWERKSKSSMRKFLGVMNLFVILIVVVYPHTYNTYFTV